MPQVNSATPPTSTPQPAVRRDAIFYQIFKRFPSLFFSLLDHPPDQARNYRFESVEIKEPTFRIDGVFLPPPGATPKTVFFSEIQFQRDESLYDRFFAEAHLYLYRNPGLHDDWYGVILFPTRSLEPQNADLHRTLLNGTQITRIYLDELGDPTQQPIGISLIQLTTASETQMAEQARQLIDRVQQESTPFLSRTEIIEVITTIAVYKFATLSREEVEAMLGLSLEETRIYQDLEHETKLKTAARLLNMNYSIEAVAEAVDLSIEEVRQLAQPRQS